MGWRKLDSNGNEKIVRGSLAPDVPACSCYMAASETLTTSVAKTLSFATEEWDTDGMHDPGDPSKITIRTAGKYLVHAAVPIGISATGDRYLSLLKNGSAVDFSTIRGMSNAGVNSHVQITKILDLVPGDYLQVSAWQDSGGNLTANSGYSIFQVIRLGPPLVTSGPAITYGSSFPLSPKNGDIHMLDTGQAGVVWQFRYNANSASTYKWEFIGGPPMWIKEDSASVHNSASYGDPNISGVAGPSITLPRDGDYDIDFGSRFGGAAGSTYTWASLSVSGAAANDTDALFLYGTNDDMITSRRIRQTAVTGTRVIAMKFKTSSAFNATFDRRTIACWPVRCI